MTPGQLYVLIVTLLLFAALGASIPVLAGIVRDARERQRERRTAERKPDDSPGDEHPDRSAANAVDADTEETSLTCRQCGAENEPGFTYCYRCIASL